MFYHPPRLKAYYGKTLLWGKKSSFFGIYDERPAVLYQPIFTFVMEALCTWV